MDRDFKWPDSSNKGTALLKLTHQRLANPLFKDEYLQWFVDDGDFAESKMVDSLATRADDPEKEFQRIAFWYAGLREKFFDDLVQEAIQNGAKQLLLLGSGFDTRYLRLEGVSDSSIQTFEVDLAPTISEKSNVLKVRLGETPPNLHLIPFDFNRGRLDCLFDYGLSPHLPTVCIWQGVSYYLPKETVKTVLKFMSEALSKGSVIGFDGCSPSMLTEDDQVPGIRFNIKTLKTKGEPYVFGMRPAPMRLWLGELGCSDVRSVDQQELEEMYAPGIGLPTHMWYIVTAKSG